VAVNPPYTSQACSRCGSVDRGNHRTQALFACLACGHTENAAHNILAAGHAVWAARSATCASGGQVCLRPERANNRAGMLKQNVDGESYSVIPMAFM
jgi:putative transposase